MKITYMCGILILLLIVPVTGMTASETQEEVPAKNTVPENTTLKLPEGGNLNKTRIESGAFFEKDKYALSDLTEGGKKLLQEFTKKVLVAKTDYAERYAGLSIVLTITTTCYDEPPLSTLRAKTINAYLRQGLLDHDRADRKLKIRYKVVERPEENSEETQGASETDLDTPGDLPPTTYDISAELKIKERGPRVSHPTDIILYEVMEE
jgi:hypothetical protein